MSAVLDKLNTINSGIIALELFKDDDYPTFIQLLKKAVADAIELEKSRIKKETQAR